MSKKHFIELADMIRNNREAFSHQAVIELAHFCRRQNPAFKESRWMDYIDGKCGSSGGAIKSRPEMANA